MSLVMGKGERVAAGSAVAKQFQTEDSRSLLAQSTGAWKSIFLREPDVRNPPDSCNQSVSTG
jgi:hypothetical protein